MAAETDADPAPNAAVSPTLIADMLREAGFKGKILSDNLVESATSGLKYLVFVDADGWLQFALSLRESGEFPPASTNEFNRRYRFSKMYHDKDDDLVLSGDYYLSGDTEKCFNEILAVWNRIVDVFIDFIGKNRPNVSEPKPQIA